MNCLLLWEKLKGGFQLVVCNLQFVCGARRDIQNFNAIASYSIVAEFTNETGKSFKAKLLKISILKRSEDLNNNIGSTCRFRNKTN
jgi:DNA topoisomerase-1